MTITKLDAVQCVEQAFDEAVNAFQVTTVGGSGGPLPVLVQNSSVPFAYDSVAMTYVPSGNGAGQIATAKYYVGGLAGTLVATLTMSYNTSNQLTSVVRT